MEQETTIPSDQILVDPTEIGKALTAVIESRSQLTVRIDDRLTPYVSLLVEVDSEERVLYIDELLPQNGNDALGNGERFSIRALCRGIPVFFGDNQILSAESEDETGPLTYKVPFPEKLVYQQRRQFFRVTVAANQNCNAVLVREHAESGKGTDALSLRGRVIDLSQRGFGVQFPGLVSPEMIEGECIQECEISLPDLEYVTCQAEVRYFFYDEQRDISVAGLRFDGLAKPDQRMIDRYVLQLQREARKGPSG